MYNVHVIAETVQYKSNYNNLCTCTYMYVYM